MCNNEIKILEEQLFEVNIYKEIIIIKKHINVNFVKIYIYMMILKIIIQIARKDL